MGSQCESHALGGGEADGQSGPLWQLQGPNVGKLEHAEFEAKLRTRLVHLEFAVRLCLGQLTEGRHILRECREGTTSWATAVVRRTLEKFKVYIVDCHYCCYSMASEYLKRTELVKDYTCGHLLSEDCEHIAQSTASQFASPRASHQLSCQGMWGMPRLLLPACVRVSQGRTG